MNASWSRRLALLSLVAYFACLPMIAFCLGGRTCNLTSWNVLIYGWIAMAMVPHPPHAIWLANPTLLIAWGFIAGELGRSSDQPARSLASTAASGQKTAAVVASGLALVVAACFLLPVGVVDNEGGVPVGVTSRRAGYWLWLVSMLSAFASAMLLPAPVASSNRPGEESSK